MKKFLRLTAVAIAGILIAAMTTSAVAATNANSRAVPQSKNVSSSNSVVLQAHSNGVSDADTVVIKIAGGGTVTVTNAEGKTLVLDSNSSVPSGTMAVFDAYHDAPGSNTSMVFIVPNSESFTFHSSTFGMNAAVSGGDYVYSSVQSKSANSIVIKSDGNVDVRGNGDFDYRIFLGSINTIGDMIFKGKATNSMSLELTTVGVLANGVAAGTELKMLGDVPSKDKAYSIPSGHDQVLLTGSADDVKAYDADGNQISIQLIVPQPLKWWQKQPAWVQWILRYLCFGWIWMK
jgi:hypothetical protein